MAGSVMHWMLIGVVRWWEWQVVNAMAHCQGGEVVLFLCGVRNDDCELLAALL